MLVQPDVLRPGWALPCTLGCSPVGFSSGTRPPEILFRYRFIPEEKSTLHFSACPSLWEEPWTWAAGQRDVGREGTLLEGAYMMGSSWWRPQMRGSPFVHSEVAFLVPRCGPPSPAVSEACRSFRPSAPLSVLGCSHRLPPR